jgi:PAS domain S-box-containing protein
MVTGPSGRSQAALLTERPIAGTDRRVLTVSDRADPDADTEKYRQLFGVESDALFLLDGETADILDANPAAFRLYQYGHEELIGMNAITLTAEPEESAAMLHNPVGRIPLRYHRKADGTVFPVEILYNDFEHRGRRTRIVTVRDITERVSTEQQTVEQGKFDQLRVDLWELVGAPCESERELISTVLAHIGGVMDLSRVSLWRRDPETGDFALVHQWYSKRSQPSSTTFISREQARLLFGKPHVVLPDDALPALAESVRQAFYDEDIVACLALPCGEGEEPESFATFSECGDKQEWRQLEIDYLQEAVRIIQLRSVKRHQF